MEAQKHWYVIHTYSGYENKVKASLERKVKSLDMEDKIFRVVIPMENEVEVNDEGKKRVVQRKVFPGYVLVEMIVDDKTWYIVRNTPGVTGFVGPDNKQPIPLTEEEMKGVLHLEPAASETETVAPEKAIRPKIDLQLQQLVRLKSDLYSGVTGTVSEIDEERGKIKVLLTMFGRETPVEVDYTQIEKVEEEGGANKMAKKITKVVKLQVPAAKATPAPPVGPALGQAGVNIMAFVKEFNARTAKQAGLIIPVEITVFEDRSFTFITKTPPAAILLKKAAGLEKASGEPNKKKVGKVSRAKAREIAESKMADLNAADVDAATKMIEGTARSMGIEITD